MKTPRTVAAEDGAWPRVVDEGVRAGVVNEEVGDGEGGVVTGEVVKGVVEGLVDCEG
jgi:hypothetical protein